MVKRDALALASRRFMGLYLPRGRDLGPILVVWAMSILILVFETDLGTSLLFFGMFVIMLYVATERTSWIVFGLLMSAVGAVGVASFESHIQTRVHAWLDPMREYKLSQAGVQDGTLHSEQAMQALWAFGSGGTMGTGWGQGHSDLIKFAANSDFILATFGEELGLAGVMAILLIYGLIVERGVRTALAARDPFGKLLAIGLSGAFALQVFVVAGGVMGLIPLTGMTMPFVAYGGSSVLANWALIGILIRISDTARRPATHARQQPRRRDDPGGPPVMNKPLRRIAIFCGLLVLALLIRDNWLQYAQADKLRTDPHNRRVTIERFANPRGDIIVDGNPITDSVKTEHGDFKYKRTYKNGPCGPRSPATPPAFDGSLLEKVEDGILTGNDDRLFFRKTLDMITGKPQMGGNVVSTLNGAAQKAAYEG